MIDLLLAVNGVVSRLFNRVHSLLRLILISGLWLGRAALQKRIMTLLRKIEHCTPGCLQVTSQFLSFFIDVI